MGSSLTRFSLNERHLFSMQAVGSGFGGGVGQINAQAGDDGDGSNLINQVR